MKNKKKKTNKEQGLGPIEAVKEERVEVGYLAPFVDFNHVFSVFLYFQLLM